MGKRWSTPKPMQLQPIQKSIIEEETYKQPESNNTETELKANLIAKIQLLKRNNEASWEKLEQIEANI